MGQSHLLQQPKPGTVQTGAHSQQQEPGQAEQSCPRAGCGGSAGAATWTGTVHSPAAGWQEVGDTRRGRRRRSRKCLRRSRRSKKSFTSLTIFNNNLNGYNGKRASIAELLKRLEPTVVTFQETAVSGSNKINQKKYMCFQRNRKGV